METLIIIIVIVVALFILGWYISVSNNLNRALVKIDEANSGIDVALTKRYDVLTKMMDVVKAYSKHEKETLFEVIKMRNNMTMEEKNEVNNKMTHNFEQIRLLVENYPELKSNINYIQLQTILSDVEDQIAAARRTYNAHVTDYNTFIKIFIPYI